MAKTATAVKEREIVREPVRAGIMEEPGREPARHAIHPSDNVLSWTDPNTGKTYTRAKSFAAESVLDFPVNLVPDGFTYQWIRESVYNQPDAANMTSRGRQGWTPVPEDRHKDQGYLTVHEGLRLYEAPTVFVKAAREEEDRRAKGQRHNAQPTVDLPGGYEDRKSVTFARVGNPIPSDPSQRTPYRRVDIDS